MKKKILYVHGWLSSGESNTSTILKEALPDYEIICPDVPIKPLEALKYLQNIINTELPEIIIGTSLGGFYANLLKGSFKILVNPAFNIPKQVIYEGIHKFHNIRKDNIQSFEFNNLDIQDLLKLETEQFSKLSWEEIKSTNILIGTQDTVVTNTLSMCQNIFGKDKVITCPFEHRLDKNIIYTYILPIIKNKDKTVENISNFNPIGPNELD